MLVRYRGSAQRPVQLERSFVLQPEPVSGQEEATGAEGHLMFPESSDKEKTVPSDVAS